MPDAGLVREALAACPFVVVSDCIADTDTSRFAHVQPARRRLGREGRHGHQFASGAISRQRALFAAARRGAGPTGGSSREVAPARWAGATAFAYDRPADIYREHARLSAYQNDGARLFDLGAHARDRQSPTMTRWSRSAGAATPFADGRFPTPDGKARLVPVSQRRSRRRSPNGR